MSRTTLAAALMLLAGTGAGQAQDGPPPGGTEMEMHFVTVKDQNQLRGLYGRAWQPGEVQQEAAKICAAHSMQLIYFQPGKVVDKKGRTEFVAVCQ